MTDVPVLEVITMGRIGVDLYPEQIGVPLAEVTTFNKFLGGSPTNVAVAASRLGRSSAVITKVGDDGFGQYVKEALHRFGVDARWVGTDPNLRTPITFCEIYPPDDFPLLFYRQPSAPDLQLRSQEIDLAAVGSANVFWTTGTGLSEEPSRTATLDALEARPQGGTTVHDLDYRPMFWRSSREAGIWAREALRYASVAIGNQDEVEMAVGTRDPMAASSALLDLGVDLAVVKQGPRGVLARTVEQLVEVQPLQVRVLNGLGAGDAFGGALCHGLLADWDLEHVIRFANAAGAIVASRLACADAMPTEGEIDELVERGLSVS
jgi:5-dehydro-2-deoxygluconokinase